MASHRETGVSSVSRRKNATTTRSYSQDKDKTSSEKQVNFKRDLETKTLAGILSIVIFFGSILHENEMVPDSYFSNKDNPLNQIYVKWAWGWTLCVMTPFLLLLSWTRVPGQVLPALRGILRLVVLTAAWYFWVEIVMYTVHERTGKCSIEAHGSSRACRRSGGRWDGFDISGHSFLLVLIVLTTHEELAPLWRLHESTGEKDNDHIDDTHHKDKSPLLEILQKTVLYLLAIIISLLQSLSVAMVIATSLYFHDMSHKILGTLIAIVTWFLTYRVWFISESKFALYLRLS